MARTRTIRPDFWNDETLANVSRDSRLTFVGMWTASDDYGTVRGHPIWLKNQIFPYDILEKNDFIVWLIELETIGVIVPFQVNEEKYYFIRNFLKHQKIDNPSKTRNPQYSPDTSETIAIPSLHNSFESKINKSKLNKRTMRSNERGSLVENFEILWKTYPVKRDKAKALTVFKKINPQNGIFETMINAINNQIKNKETCDKNKKFCPEFQYLERWLKNKRWEDETESQEIKKEIEKPQLEDCIKTVTAKLGGKYACDIRNHKCKHAFNGQCLEADAINELKTRKGTRNVT